MDIETSITAPKAPIVIIENKIAFTLTFSIPNNVSNMKASSFIYPVSFIVLSIIKVIKPEAKTPTMQLKAAVMLF